MGQGITLDQIMEIINSKGTQYFSNVIKEISEELPALYAEELKQQASFWITSPDVDAWEQLQIFIYSVVDFDSTDESSCKIYSILWNMPEDEVREAMQDVEDFLASHTDDC